LAISPDARHLYATTYNDDSSRIVVLKRNRRKGGLSIAASYEAGEAGLVALTNPGPPTVSRDGRTVYVPVIDDSALIAMKRNKRTGLLRQVDREVDGVRGVDGLGFVFAAAVSPDGRHVYATGTSDGAVAIFRRNRRSGRLIFAGARFNGAGGGNALSNPYDVVVSADGKNVYVAADADRAVTVFRRNRKSGGLRFRQALSASGSIAFEGPFRIAAGPRTRELYVGDFDKVVVAKRRR
jgi:DNA-binding beta-propeller fold protein YncE